ncbi:hypothetical protein ACMD2_12495 [Ananas comosus]|uniref:Uncharacterized protein n=1 Tax=Ananas comosus TaxID=4615 RepID=A0A199VFN3_ANACO|nr:hypothetical protein ACMD2_12495 [Ananas comosus]
MLESQSKEATWKSNKHEKRTVLLGWELQSAAAQAPCNLICFDNVLYVTCTSSGGKKLPPMCSCCYLPDDCTLHLSDGTSINC